MTETCGFCVMNPHGRAKLGSVGVPFPGVAAEIRRFDRDDAVGTVCKTDEIGELVVRGDIVIKNYFDERPGAFTTDGWLRTGDLGRADEDGIFGSPEDRKISLFAVATTSIPPSSKSPPISIPLCNWPRQSASPINMRANFQCSTSS